MIKGLADLLKKYKDGTIADPEAFETELNKALPESWIPKSTYNELSDKHKLTETQLKESNDQLATLKDKAGLSDDYKKQIDDLTAAQKTAKADYEKQLADLKHGYALNDAIKKANGKDAKLVRSIIDESKLIYNEDGTITGLEEQLKTAKDSYAYLFNEDANEPKPPKPSFGNPNPDTGGNGSGSNSMLDTMLAAAGVK